MGGFAEKRGLFTADTRLFLFTGVLAGFTTFSAFGLETTNLLRRGEAGVAVSYVALSVLCGCGFSSRLCHEPGSSPSGNVPAVEVREE